MLRYVVWSVGGSGPKNEACIEPLATGDDAMFARGEMYGNSSILVKSILNGIWHSSAVDLTIRARAPNTPKVLSSLTILMARVRLAEPVRRALRLV